MILEPSHEQEAALEELALEFGRIAVCAPRDRRSLPGTLWVIALDVGLIEVLPRGGVIRRNRPRNADGRAKARPPANERRSNDLRGGVYRDAE